MSGLWHALTNARPSFRPEIESLLDAELKRHKEVVTSLRAYVEEEDNGGNGKAR